MRDRVIHAETLPRAVDSLLRPATLAPIPPQDQEDTQMAVERMLTGAEPAAELVGHGLVGTMEAHPMPVSFADLTSPPAIAASPGRR
jgi:hypothetical protein